MPTLAGWYLSHEACRAWLNDHNPSLFERKPRAGAAALRLAITRDLEEKGLAQKVDLGFIYPPGFTGPLEEMTGWGLLLARRSSMHKVYLPRDPDPTGFDILGRKILNQNYGLELPEWSVVWWNSEDPMMKSEFLQPGTT
ncbi:hypothetical protein FRC09_018517 [Ceratobasidium sp. 395]|nr:hypothetical protein FRC09_018517 [Ceratobasidium sp. 395]